MRIRSTKPEFWRSERIASVSWDARLVLKGLESYVDDNGVGRDDIALIVSDVFPRDLVASPPVTLARVSEAISALESAGLVWRYEAESTPLLFVAFWDSIQRIDKPGRGRFRRPDGTMEYKQSEIRESVASPPVILAPGAVEQRNRGTGEQRQEQPSSAEPMARPKYPIAFERFWKTYPRKVGKDSAWKAWQQVRGKVEYSEIMRAVERMAADPNLPDESFIPHPTTWLRRGGWDDAPFPPRSNGRASPGNRIATSDQRVADGLDLARRLAQREAQDEQQQRMEIEA